MKATYRITRGEWISFEISELSTVDVGDRISHMELESVKVKTRGSLSKDNIHVGTVKIFSQFLSTHADALRRLA